LYIDKIYCLGMMLHMAEQFKLPRILGGGGGIC
jgi:hypothetical protein